ncbi:hypothetical protein [Pararhizobium sp.]|uniref:hypothetical protein n=1 Tax=Pararhizobium sp. TaxID=1977563 RepID=UPI00271DEFBD|nr:hypothetical protein [Pararhizobium sp.]MDO9418710.1 hypothetical protein [Pararhizobium sp.]
MPLLSICLPSNRNLKDSLVAIESALAYADAVDCLVILSDNSGDPEKRVYFEGRSPRLTYLIPPDDSAMTNMMNTLKAVTTPFLMPMGDDDEIYKVEGEERFDLEALPMDFIGVRPQTQIWTRSNGVLQTERFTIDADGSDERILEYNLKACGNNSIYYSVFRSDYFRPLLNIFEQAHPTQGGYCDWALCFTLFAGGKMAYDPATLYRYDFGRWAEKDSAEEARLKLFRTVGLPEKAEDFSSLLTFADLHVFLMLGSLPLTTDQRSAALVMNCRIALSTFLRKVRDEPEKYDEISRYLAGMIEENPNVDNAFQISVMLMDSIQPGLKDRYVSFYQQAIAA